MLLLTQVHSAKMMICKHYRVSEYNMAWCKDGTNLTERTTAPKISKLITSSQEAYWLQCQSKTKLGNLIAFYSAYQTSHFANDRNNNETPWQFFDPSLLILSMSTYSTRIHIKAVLIKFSLRACTKRKDYEFASRTFYDTYATNQSDLFHSILKLSFLSFFQPILSTPIKGKVKNMQNIIHILQ